MTTPKKSQKAPKTKTVKPPAWVQIGGVRYEIVEDELTARQRYHQYSDTLSLGFFSYTDQTVTLEPKQNADAKVDTLIHELIHAVYWQYGGHHIIGTEEEEKIVCFFSNALTDLLQRNPELVSYIMSVNNDG